MRHNGRSRPRVGPPALISFLLALVFAGGCTERQEPITSYVVKKHDLIQLPLEDAEPEYPMTDPTDRMLGAVILLDGFAWYFKGVASIEKWPENASEKFDALLTSLKFEDPEKPTWELGDDWTEKPPSSRMRAADLELGDVKFSVIKLPITESNERSYLLLNINRWRKQLSLGKINSAQLASSSHKIKTADGVDATVIDFLGKSDQSAMPPMMRGPMAGGPAVGKKPTESPPPKSVGSGTGTKFASKPPESWQKQKTMPGFGTVEKYKLTDEDNSAVVSISTARGGVMANVNRWRGQVGLAPVEKEEDVNAVPVKISGTDGLLVRLVGETKSIVAVMVPYNNVVWFFKFNGDSELVKKESDSFDEYLKTVELN